jgi:parallel beta-helix repeat protein
VANEIDGATQAVTNYPLNFGSSQPVSGPLHTGITIAANKFFGNGQPFESGNTADMISVFYASGALIAANELSDGGDMGISVVLSNGVTVVGNQVSRVQHAGIVVDGSASVNVAGNVLIGNGKNSMTVGSNANVRAGILVMDYHRVDSNAVYIDQNRFENDAAAPTQLQSVYIQAFAAGVQPTATSIQAGEEVVAANSSTALLPEDAGKALTCGSAFQNWELRLPRLSSVPEYSVYSLICATTGLNADTTSTFVSLRAAGGDVIRAGPACDAQHLKLALTDATLTIVRGADAWTVPGAKNACIPGPTAPAPRKPDPRLLPGIRD